MEKKKILIIDDADLFREIMGDLLAERGLEVSGAKDGIEGLEKIRRHCFDLVVLDLLLPRMTGFDVLKEIRKDPAGAELPVLAVSGVFKKDEHMAALRDMGACGYISKALSPTEMAGQIMRTIDEASGSVKKTAPPMRPATAPTPAPAVPPTEISLMDLFRGLDQKQQEEIKKISRRVRFSRGQVIIREGEAGDRFYGILAGTVRVEKRGPSGDATVIARLGTGAEFGELALLDREVRSATCIAETDAAVMEIARPEFEQALAADPELERRCLRALLMIMAGRLRETDQSLTFSRALLDKVIEPGS